MGSREEPQYYFAWGLDELRRAALVELAHIRLITERFYQDAKGELGLDDYEGRLWTGFHRHVALVMLCHSYLTLRQTYAGAGGEEATPDGPARTATRSSDTPGRGFPLSPLAAS